MRYPSVKKTIGLHFYSSWGISRNRSLLFESPKALKPALPPLFCEPCLSPRLKPVLIGCSTSLLKQVDKWKVKLTWVFVCSVGAAKQTPQPTQRHFLPSLFFPLRPTPAFFRFTPASRCFAPTSVFCFGGVPHLCPVINKIL